MFNVHRVPVPIMAGPVTTLLVLLCPTVILSKQVIQMTPKLRKQGYHRDINLSEVIAEGVVDSPASYGRLCEANPACHSVMLIGQLCRMFQTSHCLVSTIYHLQVYYNM